MIEPKELSDHELGAIRAKQADGEFYDDDEIVALLAHIAFLTEMLAGKRG